MLRWHMVCRAISERHPVLLDLFPRFQCLNQIEVTHRKECYVRNHINRFARSDVTGRPPRLASQQELGLCSDRRAGFARGCSDRPGFGGKNLSAFILLPRTTYEKYSRFC